MLGITLKERKSNNWIRQSTKIDDSIRQITTLQWNWAGHVARSKDQWREKIIKCSIANSYAEFLRPKWKNTRP